MIILSSNSIEEYLEAIHYFNEQGRLAKNTDIAKMLNVSPPSVTQMVQKLAEEGLLEYKPYKGAMLTGKGMAIAQNVVRKHRLLERFLHDQLGLQKEKVHDEACKMEHRISDEVAAALCSVLDNPSTCPDDEKDIPPCTLDCVCEECEIARNNIKSKLVTQLSFLNPGEEAYVDFIRAGQNACQRLLDMGFTKGTMVKVVNAAPFHGPMEIKIRETSVALGRRLASQIFVEMKTDVLDEEKNHRLDRHHVVA